MAPAPDRGRDADAVSAGRGVVFILFAKVWFMVAGAAIQFSLPNLLGPAAFGVYHFVVTTTASALNNVVVTSTIQAVSRTTTEHPGRPAAVRRRALGLQLVVGGLLALAYAAAAPLIVLATGDSFERLGVPLLLSAAIVLLYALYATFVGSANGQRLFHKQAALDVVFSTTRALLIILFAALGLGVVGAVGGFVLAAIAIVAVAAAWIGRGRPEPGPPLALAPMARFLASVAAYAALLNALMNVDVWVLKAAATRALGEADAANRLVGYYGGAQNIARLSYQLTLAITFVLFPLVSRATFESDVEATRGYVRQTMRYTLLAAAALGAVMLANPSELLAVPYRDPAYRAAGPALAFLAVANVLFALFTIAGTVLNAAGRTRAALRIAGSTLALDVALTLGAVAVAPAGPALLWACGAATCAAMTFGLVVSGVSLSRAFGAFMPAATVLRVAAATAAASALGRVIPERSRLLTLVESALVGVAFVAVLVATRELGRADLQRALGLVRRRPA